ncbi:MAG: TraB/GumN family protein [Flavobacteriales bacterium]
MIKGLCLFSFLVATIIGYTQSGAKADSCSLLWSISGNGLRDTSYLFGTMHSSDDRLRRWDDNWQKAFESCGIIAGETDLAHGSLDMLSMLQTLMIDTTIEKVLPPSKVETIRNYIAQRLGPEMASVMMKMQPFFLMVLLMELPEDLTEVGEVMDIYLQGLASQKGKQVVGLETSTEQLEVIKGVPILYQAEMLYEFVSLSSKGLQLDVMALSDSLIIQTYLHQCLNDFVVVTRFRSNFLITVSRMKNPPITRMTRSTIASFSASRKIFIALSRGVGKQPFRFGSASGQGGDGPEWQRGRAATGQSIDRFCRRAKVVSAEFCGRGGTAHSPVA